MLPHLQWWSTKIPDVCSCYVPEECDFTPICGIRTTQRVGQRQWSTVQRMILLYSFKPYKSNWRYKWSLHFPHFAFFHHALWSKLLKIILIISSLLCVIQIQTLNVVFKSLVWNFKKPLNFECISFTERCQGKSKEFRKL